MAWADPFTVPVPILVAPSKNVTVPVGTGGPAGEIVAVNVIDCPNVDGFNDEAKVVVLPDAVIV